MSTFYTGVAVITAFDQSDTLHAMTCTSLTAVTLEPPTLLVCLNSSSGTLRAAVQTRRFGVNILRAGAIPVAEFFSRPGPRDGAPTTYDRSPHLNQPWLPDDSVAMAECRVSGLHEMGSHTVVFGHVTENVTTSHPPLLFGRRTYHRARPDGR
jgi:flavin reductase (DIM6/NTAB) family NADH-FMN oxidoreductase RutF